MRTPDFKRLPGFAKIYLGAWGERIAFISTILGLFGALLAYLIVGGEFLANLLSPFFGGGNFLYTFLYFCLGAILIFFGIKIIAKVEFWGLILFFLILLVIFWQGQQFLKIGNLFPVLDKKYLFLPYGAILFSLWGASLIPEVEEMLGEKKALLKKVIVTATLLPILVYFFFIYFILGITGSQTAESAITGLRNILGEKIVALGLFIGVLTTFTSFIALGLTLKKVFMYDLKIGKFLAWAATCFVPLFLFFLGFQNFINVISLVGGIMLGIDGILILLMYQKATKKKFVYPLALIFLAGILYEIIYFIKF